MGRLIVSGARVQLRSGTSPRRGEIWAYCRDEAVIIHRCVGRRGDRFRFRGDGAPAADPLVAREFLVGRVVAVDQDGARRPLATYDRLVRGARQQVRAAFTGARRRLGRLWGHSAQSGR